MPPPENEIITPHYICYFCIHNTSNPTVDLCFVSKVTGIVGRADVLACIFFLMSLLLYWSSVTSISQSLGTRVAMVSLLHYNIVVIMIGFNIHMNTLTRNQKPPPQQQHTPHHPHPPPQSSNATRQNQLKQQQNHGDYGAEQ